LPPLTVVHASGIDKAEAAGVRFAGFEVKDPGRLPSSGKTMKNSLQNPIPSLSPRRLAPAIGLFLVAGLFAAAPAGSQQPQRSGPPATRTDAAEDDLHGVKIPDPYRWLEDQNSPETRAWIDAQNEYSESFLRAFAGREQIQQRLTELMKVDSIGLPRARAGRYFFLKRGANQDLFVLYSRQGLHGSDAVLVDPHPLSSDHSTSVNLLGVSEDGRLVVYGVRAGGQDEITIRLLDTQSGQALPDQLPKADYFTFGSQGVGMKPDRSGFYYTRMTPQGPRVFYHAMGTDPAADPTIFGNGYGPEKLMFAQLTEDGRYLLIHVLYGSGTERSEIYFQDLAAKTPVRPLVNDVPAFFAGEPAGDTFYAFTNWKAPKFRIMAMDLKNPAQEHWREAIPEGEFPIESFYPAGGKLLVEYTRNATSEVKIFSPTGKFLRELPLPALGTVNGVQARWSSNEVFYSFTSFPIPAAIYRFDLAKGTQEVWTRPEVPIESGQFEVKQVWYSSKDGTRVPMFLFYKKGLRPDGSHPALLTAYGGFGVSIKPAFSAEAAAFVERGGVYAVPNLRGGGEFGEAWHHAGMLEKKQNVFDDFNAAAEWLVANGYTQPSRLVIQGASNGGLLVGAALTQRPELYRAVICSYPLLDMIRYQKFLVAKWWVPEYGSSDNPEQLNYLLAYSPYQNLHPGTKYPAVLFVTGDGDTRVAPLHARKMAARLQAATGSDRPVLLLYDTKSGHSGGRPLSKLIEENTDILSFLFSQVSAATGQPGP
jgi:prolyl oligopeptidase